MPSRDPYKRHSTRHRGVTYRERADGSRSYYVWAGGRFIAVEGGEREALAKQAELRGRIARGEKVAPLNVKFEKVAEEWFASKRKLRTRSRENYRAALDRELLPRFGKLKLAQVTADRVAAMIGELEQRGMSASMIVNTLKPLNGTFKFAARRHGLTVPNPVTLLSGDERPTFVQKGFRELGPTEIDRLLEVASATPYFGLVKTAVYSGLRLGELLGLQWQDVDFDRGELNVRRQWAQEGAFTDPKTPKSIRRVIVAPDLLSLLRTRKEEAFAIARARPEDLVFPSRVGTPLGHRNVARAFTAIVDEAGLGDEPRLTFHGLRHVYASSMVERGISSVVLAGQMGHASPTVTEARYLHLFNRVRTDEAVRSAMQEAMRLGKPLASTAGNERENGVSGGVAKVASLHEIAPAGSG